MGEHALARQIAKQRSFAAIGSSRKSIEEAPVDEEWLKVLRTYRKSGAPKKVLQAAQERCDAGELSQSMVIKTLRTLERMDRDDLMLKLLLMEF